MNFGDLLEQVNRNPQMDEQLLQQAAVNPVQYVNDLATAIASPGLGVGARHLAALQFKNALKNVTKMPALEDIWQKLDPANKPDIRNKVLGTLADPERNLRTAASMAVAAIAEFDIPTNQWPDLLQILINNAASTDKNIKLASLQTLGYICEVIAPNAVSPENSAQILTAIVNGLMPEELDAEIKLVAAEALINSLKFISTTMQMDAQRQMLFDILKQATTFGEEKVRETIYRAFAEIAVMYYNYINTQLGMMWDITLATINTDTPTVCCQAIEFWSSIADAELRRADHPTPNMIVGEYTAIAAPMLVPLLLQNLHKYDLEDDQWNLHKACSTTLGNVVALTKDLAIDGILQYVEANIGHQEPTYRESAVVLFGNVLQGPDRNKLQQCLSRIIQPLIGTLTADPLPKLRVSAAWTFGKIAENLTDYCLDPSIRDNLLNTFVGMFEQKIPKVSAHICWAIINMTEGGRFELNGQQYDMIIESLLAQAYSDVSTIDSMANLRVAAYAAIGSLIEKCSYTQDTQAVIQSKVAKFVNMLQQVSANLPQNEDSQVFLSSALQSAFGALRSEDLSDEVVDMFMQTVVAMFQAKGDVVEETIQAVGALASTIEERFRPYLKDFGPFLIFSLQQQKSQNVVRAGTMALGDLSRALGSDMSPFLHELVPPLVNNLKDNSISTEIKVQSICSLGDLAGATQSAFLAHTEEVLQYIDGAAGASLGVCEEANDPDMFEFLLFLREAILEFYVGLIQGLLECQQLSQISNRLPQVIEYACLCLQPQYYPNENIFKSILGLIGDICKNERSIVPTHVTPNTALVQFIQTQKMCNNPKVRELANWCAEQVGGI